MKKERVRRGGKSVEEKERVRREENNGIFARMRKK
jgi:hypothetical protein